MITWLQFVFHTIDERPNFVNKDEITVFKAFNLASHNERMKPLMK